MSAFNSDAFLLKVNRTPVPLLRRLRDRAANIAGSLASCWTGFARASRFRRRFLERLWRTLIDPAADGPLRPELLADAPRDDWSAATLELERALNRMLKRVDDSFDGFNFNTAIAGMMTFLNEVAKRTGALVRSQVERLVLAVSPFAPHLGEELWRRLGHTESIAYAPWPAVDPEHLEEDDFELVVQVHGKVRGRARAPRDASKEALEALARETVAAQLEGKQLIKTVVIPGRLVNFVVR